LKRAGTVIFAFSVVMWAGTHYPKPAKYSRDYSTEISKIDAEIASFKEWADDHGTLEVRGVRGDNELSPSDYVEHIQSLNEQRDALRNAQANEVLENSVAGRVGKFIAPVFYPLGYDWKTSIGVTGAFFAREVVVSTMGICYSVGDTENSTNALQKAMKDDKWTSGPRAGKPVWTPLVAISLMVFVVFCMQCLSTLAIARKETGHWGWPVFMFFYMTALAWVAAFIVYQGGTLLHLG
jgi:ferrous iron transport protein B